MPYRNHCKQRTVANLGSEIKDEHYHTISSWWEVLRCLNNRTRRGIARFECGSLEGVNRCDDDSRVSGMFTLIHSICQLSWFSSAWLDSHEYYLLRAKLWIGSLSFSLSFSYWEVGWTTMPAFDIESSHGMSRPNWVFRTLLIALDRKTFLDCQLIFRYCQLRREFLLLLASFTSLHLPVFC